MQFFCMLEHLKKYVDIFTFNIIYDLCFRNKDKKNAGSHWVADT